LAEKEESVKSLTLKNSSLEIEAEGFNQRLRSLDESESRYKDENWNLETQIHESIAAAKEAAGREQKLTQSLNILQAEKSSAQKELDEIKLIYAKLTEDHAAAVKHYDVELGSVKRSITMAENEKGALQRKIEDLTGQNQELARAVAHQRGRLEERDQIRGLSDEDFETAPDDHTPEHSPPPSPVKGTPRHSMLESETMKSSLHHAHRMIQNLKANIHREKTEKLELKRMLQDARDDLDSARRGDPGSAASKRTRKVDSKEFKKPPRPGQLGQVRNSRSEIFIEDPNWEEDDGQKSPTYSASVTAARAAGLAAPSVSGSEDHFHSSRETETSDAFETANEGATETEDFQTGAEEMSESDELTETEGGPTGTLRINPPPFALTKPGNRQSFQSTASTSGDEYSYEDIKTPKVQPQRLRLRVSRGGNRLSRSRVASEEPMFQQSSPVSFVNSSRDGTPQPAGQSLFAELGDMGGSDEDESVLGTPSRSRFTTPAHSRPSTAKNTPAPGSFTEIPPVPKLPMIDSGMMTDPWEPEQPQPPTPITAIPMVSQSTLTDPEEPQIPIPHAAVAMVSQSTLTDPEEQQTPIPYPTVPMISQSTLTDPEEQLHTPVQMISQSTWTDPEEPQAPIPHSTIPLVAGSVLAGASLVGAAHLLDDDHTPPESKQVYVSSDQYTSTEPEPERVMSDKHTSTEAEPKIQMSDAASQWHEEQLTEQINNLLAVESAQDTRPISTSTYSDMSSQYDPDLMDEKLAKFPEPPQSHTQTHVANFAGLQAIGASLTMSSIVSEELKPIEVTKTYVELPVRDPETSSRGFFESVTASKAQTMPTPLVFSSIQSVYTEPKSPRQIPVIDVKDETLQDIFVAPYTPKSTFQGSAFGRNKNKDISAPIIAEDETRQSASNSPMAETPESQRPFRELSSNPHERAKRVVVETSDESSQTALTANQIDEMLHSQPKVGIDAEDSQMIGSPTRGPSGLRIKKSIESIGSIGRSRSKMIDSEYTHDIVSPKRPGSAGSGRAGSILSYHPPLPPDHREVIAAAAQRTGSSGGPGNAPWSGSSGEGSGGPISPRTGSSGGTPGSMGPPPLPPSALKANPSFRPRTPNSQAPLSPGRGGTTPRPIHSSGTAEIRSPSRLAQTRSRASSVSSFVSEVDTRFNLRNGVVMPHGVDSSTDPRMINAITQTMIGEYLWKYTRKAGRGTMSENRHRRYFWVHPYTRTLYWSDRDPSSAGRAELKAKSVPIEAVRVVTDDNPMPPGLHRKSLVIMTPGRSVKFTATTGQRHETWFNALSYLLLRTGEDAVADTSDVANGALTQEDVDEFNPGFGGNRSTRRGPGSLSSYNSRTTRNSSPGKSNRIPSQPHLSSTASSRPSMGTFSRLSSYWKQPGTQSVSYSSKRSRNSLSGNGDIYEASEVHDSAEDLREIIEKQDRESDKLENVRACCDGMSYDIAYRDVSNIIQANMT
jgi:hypothetical protein